MITLITGLPGHGKTLYALNYIKAKAEAEQRQVYYSGIADLNLDWIELDNPEDWYKCPAKSIVVIDECQRVFRPRGNMREVPECISRFETHRHQGLDIYLITQHPMLIDNNIRRLAGQHFHSVRLFGLAKSTVYEWPSCHEITKANFGTAIRHDFVYPAASFDWYKSAEVHTVKKNIPARVWFLVAAPFIIGGLIYGTYRILFKPPPVKEAASIVQGQSAVQGQSGGAPGRKVDAVQYVAEHTPRVAGLAFTAPVYDEVTKPQEAPVPVACVTSKSKGCRCYSQQATRLAMSQDLCAQIVANGFFEAFPRKTEANRPERPAAVPAERQAASSASAPPASPSGPFALARTAAF